MHEYSQLVIYIVVVFCSSIAMQYCMTRRAQYRGIFSSRVAVLARPQRTEYSPVLSDPCKRNAIIDLSNLVGIN